MTEDQAGTAEWLMDEMRRTGLGKSALAGALGVHKSAVSRLVDGKRRLSGPERAEAEKFFALVPANAPTGLVATIQKLRSDRVRQRVGRRLLEEIRDQHGNLPTASSSDVRGALGHELIDAIARHEEIWRADQILALCDWLRVDLTNVVESDRIGTARASRGETFSQAPITPPIEAVVAAPMMESDVRDNPPATARARLGPTGLPSHASASMPSGERETPSREFSDLNPEWATALKSIEPPLAVLDRCQSFQVDDGLEPDLVRGDIIFVNPDRSPRPGEHAVILRHDSGYASALVGRLVDEGKEWFRFRYRGRTMKIMREKRVALARIEWYLRRP
jgi:hypothetical protein